MQKKSRQEIFLGLIAPIGIDLDNRVCAVMSDYLLNKFKYNPQIIRLSELIHNVDGVKTKFNITSEFKRISSGMTAGNEARRKSGQFDILAQQSIVEVQTIRNRDLTVSAKSKMPPTINENAYIFRSIKNPAEAKLYRNVYGKGFFLLGFYSSRDNKLNYLMAKKGMSKEEAEGLIARDEEEGYSHGQQTGKIFDTSDVFFDVDSENFNDHLKRFFDLIFCHPYITPTKDEYAMFLAFSSSFRSGDMSRQVGAVISSKEGEIIATGCNDAPKKGGGLYWCDDPHDARDFKLGYESNKTIKNEIASKIVRGIKDKTSEARISTRTIRKIIKSSGLFDITEYGRAVHAEMEALMACSRVGISPRGGTIYSTTFPCHNCAKHIVAAGIDRVVFVEPYPKSKAEDLHKDSIEINRDYKSNPRKVAFQPFIGIGPRRFIDLFSVQLSNGVIIKREEFGKKVKWIEAGAGYRFPLLGMSYLEKEKVIGAKLVEKRGGRNGKRKTK